MRQSPAHQSAIRSTAAETFGDEANFWLFGSRVDDNIRVVGIDWLLEKNQSDVTAIVCAELAFLTKLQMKLEEQ